MNWKEVSVILILIIGGITLLLFPFVADAKEARLVIYNKSKHIPKDAFNEEHPAAGIEYQNGTLYYSSYFYKDSYSKNSFLAGVGASKEFGCSNPLIEVGLTHKGVMLPENIGKPIMRVIPYLMIGDRINIGPLFIKFGYIPIPRQFGSSVLITTFGIRS